MVDPFALPRNLTGIPAAAEDHPSGMRRALLGLADEQRDGRGQ
jgi:hypothetical protein